MARTSAAGRGSTSSCYVPRGLDLAGDLAELELLVVREQAVLEDDLRGDEDAAAIGLLAADVDDRAHLLGHVGPVALLDLGKVNHVVDFVRACREGVLGLERLGGDGGLAEREANRGANVDVGSLEHGVAAGALARVDGDHAEVILERLVAEFAHIGVGGVRLEVRVVKKAGEVIERIAFSYEALQSMRRHVNTATL